MTQPLTLGPSPVLWGERCRRRGEGTLNRSKQGKCHYNLQNINNGPKILLLAFCARTSPRLLFLAALAFLAFAVSTTKRRSQKAAPA